MSRAIALKDHFSSRAIDDHGGRATDHRGKTMKENVGGAEPVVRSLAGPALLLASLTVLGAREGKPVGLGALIWGAMVTETALTKTCSVNGLIGGDTAH